MLQRIETSTGVGIPDIYISLPDLNFWLETKTLAYKVSNEQLNWAATHWLAGGLTYICTVLTAYNTPALSSNITPGTTPYPQLPELLKTPIDTTQKKSQESLILLAFDDRMRDCSTLGVYLKRYNPNVITVEDWLKQL